jgi:hypothetical protein
MLSVLSTGLRLSKLAISSRHQANINIMADTFYASGDLTTSFKRALPLTTGSGFKLVGGAGLEPANSLEASL